MGKTINYYTDKDGNTVKETITTEIPVVEKVKGGFKKAKEKTIAAGKAVVGFVTDHPIATILVVSSGIKILTAGANAYAHVKNANTRAHEADSKELTVYDRRNGIYYFLKRPMTTTEKWTFASRRTEGEDVGTILADMNLI
jgi:hypothetical protein